MIYGYIRVSTDRQTVENQRLKIETILKQQGCAEIERSLISQRTSEALKRKKAEGVVLGHPKGKKNSHHKLDGKENAIRKMLAEKYTKTLISKQLGVSVSTLYLFMKEKGIMS